MVKFEDITPGIHHIRQIIEDDRCTQIYPALQGSLFYSLGNDRDHYADKVIRIMGGNKSELAIANAIRERVYNKIKTEIVIKVIIQNTKSCNPESSAINGEAAS